MEDRKPEAWMTNAPGAFLSVGDTAVWTLGGDRFRIETPHGAREVDGFDRARELAHELARD
jgi:hypothetical protein